MRLRWFRCRGASAPTLPQRVRGDNLPDWMRQPTRPLPTMGPGRVGNLTPAQQWRANGGRWSVPEQRGNDGGSRWPADDGHPEHGRRGGHHEEPR
ncbi:MULTISPECIES: hypothetical protein [unclassified Micromonospora]|uniref:hypothetical protein n=1 Tax=unclassified Micromonospora TaxID=2617518 RepID=UPI0027DB51DB|nr:MULTISPECIES: hypothetical protein [unclassified Micromonospora]